MIIDSITPLLYSPSLELVVLAAAIIINIFLAFSVYRSDTESATNIIFSLLALAITCWLVMNYAVHSSDFAEGSLVLHRLGITFAALMSSLFFLLAHTFPSHSIRLPKPFFIATLLGTALMIVLNLSPYAFTGIIVEGSQSNPVPGPGLLPFSVLSTLFSLLAVYFLIRTWRKSDGIVRKQARLILSGILIMLGLIIATVLVPLIMFNSVFALQFTPIYVLVFLGLTAYAITEYQLFEIKVLAAQALTLVLLVTLFSRVFAEQSLDGKLIDSLAVLFTAVFGFFLVRSVKREVYLRESLEIANHQQESLLHFISHEVKGYLTKAQSAFAGLAEGDYGSLSPQVKTLAVNGLADMRKGVGTVMEILNASNLKKGTVAYNKEPFNAAHAVMEVVQALQKLADEKNLVLKTEIDGDSAVYMMRGDKEKLSDHVFRNLIDNAIRYTPRGNVWVTLSKQAGQIRFEVKDSGVGITEEDKKRLFTEGGKGADSIKVNVHSTGYGLFIAKQIVDAHRGKIWAESGGRNRGSSFITELPAI